MTSVEVGGDAAGAGALDAAFGQIYGDERIAKLAARNRVDARRRIDELAGEQPTYMTSAEVLKLLRIESLITLQRYIKAGLPAHQPIPGGQRLFDRAEVIAWIKSRWIATTPDPDAR